MRFGRHRPLGWRVGYRSGIGSGLPDGTQIGTYQAEDRCRFTVTPSGITLVTREMLGQGKWNGSIA